MKHESDIRGAIAANRFGLGARPGDLERIGADPQAWLLGQLQGPGAPPATLADLPHSATILAEVQAAREARSEAKKRGQAAAAGSPSPGNVFRRHHVQQVDARLRTAVGTDHPLHERLVHFWSNHFAVSADKQPLAALAGAFENEAIRPRLSGRFSALLLAAEMHPAMLFYLDNQRSMGPDSDAARTLRRRRQARDTGLNENLAREILELHTLGVNGGYTQDDVGSLAAALTGWSVGGGRQRRAAEASGRFLFRAELHQPGPVTILGKRYADDGLGQATAVLQDLAVHPATARHVADKLARHFVADEPPPALVERLARVFLDTGGDLPAVHGALVRAGEAWEAPFAKYKTPQEFVVSTLRALAYVPDNLRALYGSLDAMGQAPYRPGSPAGWPDTAAEWGGADGLYKRIEWATAVARASRGRKHPLELGEAVLGESLGDHTRTAIARAESLEQGLVLLLVSPEFQRR
jgi:uncharacterized protein (DUF1800 family)